MRLSQFLHVHVATFVLSGCHLFLTVLARWRETWKHFLTGRTLHKITQSTHSLTLTASSSQDDNDD
jgi:hypothetical protein